jgi:hypothetical protein
MHKSFVWLFSVCLLSINGCSSHHAADESKSRTGRRDTLLAEFEGGRILENDLPREVIFEAEEVLYQTKLRQVEKLIEEKFLVRSAKKHGLSTDEFLREKVAALYSVTEQEIEREYSKYMGYFNNNPAFRSLPEKEQTSRLLAGLQLKPDPNRSFQALVRAGLRGRLSKRKEQVVIQRLVREAGVKIYLTEPEAPVYNGSLEKYPALGPVTAPVNIVDFRDFKCEFCGQSAQALEKVVEAFLRHAKTLLTTTFAR